MTKPATYSFPLKYGRPTFSADRDPDIGSRPVVKIEYGHIQNRFSVTPRRAREIARWFEIYAKWAENE